MKCVLWWVNYKSFSSHKVKSHWCYQLQCLSFYSLQIPNTNSKTVILFLIYWVGATITQSLKKFLIASTSLFSTESKFLRSQFSRIFFLTSDEYYIGKVNFCVPRYSVTTWWNTHSVFLGCIYSNKTHRGLEGLCSKYIRKPGIINCHHNPLPCSDCEMMSPECLEYRFSKSHSNSFRLSPEDTVYLELTLFCSTHIKCSVSWWASVSSYERNQTCSWQHTKIGLYSFLNPMQGSFHLTLKKVPLEPSCQNLSMTDCRGHPHSRNLE